VCKHNYTIPVDQKKAVVQNTDEYERRMLFNSIARTAACLNLSINQITSPAFNSLLTNAVSYGVTLRTNDQYLSADKLPDLTFSRTKIRQHIIEMGSDERTQTMLKAMNVKLVSAAIDNGTIVHRKLMFVALQNPLAGLDPTFYKLFTTEAWSASDFAEYGKQLFQELKDEGIVLTGIVGDNLRSQIAGLAHWMDDSFQNMPDESISPEQRAVLYVPCCCHVLNLGFMDTVRNDKFFGVVTKQMLDLSVILRKSELVRLLGARIPDVPATRWIYLYDISKWLTKHSERYAEITENSQIFKAKFLPQLHEKDLQNCIHGIPQEFKDINRLLLPVKIAMNRFEDPKTSLSDANTILTQMIEDLEQLVEERQYKKYRQHINFMNDTIRKRFRKNGRLDLIITSNAFTASGRHMFRKLGAQTDMPSTQELSDDEDEERKNQTKQETQDSIDPDPESDSEDSMEPDDELGEIIQEDNNSISAAYVEDEAQFAFEHTGFIPPDESEQLYSILMNTIQEICMRLQIDDDRTRKCFKELDSWLFQPTRKIHRIYELKENAVQYWRMENLRTKSILSTIALRLLSLGASEACCERFISQNRKTLDAYSSRQKDDLLQARNEIRANYLVKTQKKNKKEQ
jgi:hypothetical protein